MTTTTIALALAALSASCVMLDSRERGQIRQLESRGIRVPNENYKHPLAAGALNILPGFGNFYLASGTDETGQWSVGVLNLLLWPISPLWAAPQGVIDAVAINERETVRYYMYGDGREELRER